MITLEQQIYKLNHYEYNWLGVIRKASKEKSTFSRGDILLSSGANAPSNRKICILGYVTRYTKRNNIKLHGYLIKSSDNVIPKINSKGLWISFLSNDNLKNKGYKLSLKTRLEKL